MAMSRFVSAFMRVQRKLTDANHVTGLLEQLSTPDSDIDMSEDDRLAVLDLPDAASVAANVASVTALATEELVKRAVQTPKKITSEELDLLKKRFWADRTDAQKRTIIHAESDLMSVSNKHFQRCIDELEQIRASLYDQGEGEAIKSAWDEADRRRKADRQKEKDEDLQRTLASKRCPDWVERWVEETGGNDHYGFARYIDPRAVSKYDMDEYESKADAQITPAQARLSFGSVMGLAFKIQNLGWPDPTAQVSAASSRSKSPAAEDLDQESVIEDSPEPPSLRDDPDDLERRASFEMLRKHFNATVRSKSRRRSQGIEEEPLQETLEGGILDNVFLVLDEDSMYSTGWVWATDPDYTETEPIEQRRWEQSDPPYRGFVRVKLRSLVDNFFAVRKYHEEEFSMAAIWRMAQDSPHGVFQTIAGDERRPQDRSVGPEVVGAKRKREE